MTLRSCSLALLLAFACLSTSSCGLGAVGHAHQWLTGTLPTATAAGERVDQPGVSFSPPPGKSWTFLGRSSDQVTLGAFGSSNTETYVTAVSTYQLPFDFSPETFLAWVKETRAAEPRSLRYETLRNDERLYTQRPEVCVMHRMTSKDYGVKREGDFPLFDTLGMHCIHPTTPRLGVFVELSRKASSPADAGFDADGERLLQSVTFTQ